MQFQIKEVILWPKNPELKPRRVKFELGKVNIITGASRTGKSAIIPIIDYCLGSERCAIPINVIRDYCEWFGILVAMPTGMKLIARRSPGNQKTTGDMFFIEGSSIEVPNTIDKNINLDAVKHILDELAGLTNLDFDTTDNQSGFKSRPSFRDMSAFVFQPQNIVANPDVFYYKADTYEHKEKLRTIFPYVLGAVTPLILARQHELALYTKELKRKESELKNVNQISERWSAELRAKVIEARELGLISQTVPADADYGQLLDLLQSVLVADINLAQLSPTTLYEAVEELNSLRKEERQQSLTLSSLRRRMTEMTQLRESAKNYSGSVYVQRDRLRLAGWLRDKQGDNSHCPLCDHEMTTATEQIEVLCRSLEGLEITAGQFDLVPASFDKEVVRIQHQIEIETERLKGIRIRIASLENTSEEVQRIRYSSLSTSRFIGNIEKSLEIYESLGLDNELQDEIDGLRIRVSNLRQLISYDEIDKVIKNALASIELYAGRLLPNLDVENPFAPVEISIGELTVKVVSPDRENFLWEIGSGSNWLGYHVAVSLGLHQYFLGLDRNPVPSFIIYDQPSQVYFPKQLRGEEDRDYASILKDEDLDAVQRVFQALSSVVQESKGKLQVIVLDHAAENVWGQISNVHLVEEWRDGKKLVPIEWINNE